MKALLFATKKQSEDYIRDNYEGMTTEQSSLSDRSDYEGYDRVMENFQWMGETECIDIVNEEGDTIARVAWWDSGYDTYQVKIGDKTIATFNDHPHAIAMMDDLISKEEEKDDDEIQEVTLYCNGKLIDVIEQLN